MSLWKPLALTKWPAGSPETDAVFPITGSCCPPSCFLGKVWKEILGWSGRQCPGWMCDLTKLSEDLSGTGWQTTEYSIVCLRAVW